MNREQPAESARPGTPPARTKAPGKSPAGPRDEILRFQKTEILLHWSIAAPFLTCYLSALGILVLSLIGVQLPVRAILSWIHRIAGCCFIALPPLALLATRGQWRMHLYNIRQGWIWMLDDVRWLMLCGLAAVDKKIHLPDQGKFNAGEKLNFMMVMTTYPLFALTGILLWLPGTAFYSWIFHIAMAAVATPLLLGHLFMAIVNPATRVGLKGMFTGWVDRRWAEHHYTRWYRENFGQWHAAASGEGAPAGRKSPAKAIPVPAAPAPKARPQEVELVGLVELETQSETRTTATASSAAGGRPSPFEGLRFVERETLLSAPPGGRQGDPGPSHGTPGRSG